MFPPGKARACLISYPFVCSPEFGLGVRPIFLTVSHTGACTRISHTALGGQGQGTTDYSLSNNVIQPIFNMAVLS